MVPETRFLVSARSGATLEHLCSACVALAVWMLKVSSDCPFTATAGTGV
jgi:hypothetical protein